MKGFNAFLDMKTCKDGVQKVGSWKYLTNLTPVPPVFLEHQVPHSCYPPWTLFRMCQRSTAAAAQDSVTKETNGKCPGQAPICRWHPQKLNHLVVFVFGFWLHLDSKSHFWKVGRDERQICSFFPFLPCLLEFWDDCHSKCDPWTRSIGIIWELVRNRISGSLQVFRIRICI